MIGTDYLLIIFLGVETSESGVSQDEETSLEQINRQKIVEQIGFPWIRGEAPDFSQNLFSNLTVLIKIKWKI